MVGDRVGDVLSSYCFCEGGIFKIVVECSFREIFRKGSSIFNLCGCRVEEFIVDKGMFFVLEVDFIVC